MSQTDLERFSRRWRPGVFDVARTPEGKLRDHVWDRICLPGHDEKDGKETRFDVDTLTQMVRNFEGRGDLIPLDYNHQSNYAAKNGQPAPALAFYGALALVWDGKIVAAGKARDVDATGNEDGIDLARPGLYGLRVENTELGERLLPNYKYVSPTFLSNGTLRDGTPVGYCLAAVAATNTPWQSGTELTFQGSVQQMALTNTRDISSGDYVKLRNGIWIKVSIVAPYGVSGVDSSGTHRNGDVEQITAVSKSRPSDFERETGAPRATKEGHMAKLSKLAKFAGLEESAEDAEIKHALHEKMSRMAQDAFGEEFKPGDSAGQLEACASTYEEADPEDKETPAQMRRMAQAFRRMSKMDAADGDPKPPAEGKPPEENKPTEASRFENSPVFIAMSASLKATQSQLAELQAKERAREDAARKQREQQFSQLADDAVAGGYPKEARGALIEFARSNPEAARLSVAPFLKGSRSGSPQIFERYSEMGAPIGQGRSSREEGLPQKPRKVQALGRTFVEDDSSFADEIRRLAESQDPAVKAKVDGYIPNPEHRPVMFSRLLAAEKIVRKERPDLAEQAE